MAMKQTISATTLNKTAFGWDKLEKYLHFSVILTFFQNIVIGGYTPPPPLIFCSVVFDNRTILSIGSPITQRKSVSFYKGYATIQDKAWQR